MKRKSAAGEAAPDFGRQRMGKLTWLGLVVVAVGWGCMLLSIIFADAVIARAPKLLPPVVHQDLIEISRCIIVSGFGLAVVGAMQTGFGSLNRFFGAVLVRSAPREEAPAPRPSDPAASAPILSGKRRPYRIFADGSVEVDTIVGTRLFKSMAEARDFI